MWFLPLKNHFLPISIGAMICRTLYFFFLFRIRWDTYIAA